MLNDSQKTAREVDTWMFLNLPFKVIHTIIQMIFAELAADRQDEENHWDYYLLPLAADLTIFGYFWYVTHRYSQLKRE